MRQVLSDPLETVRVIVFGGSAAQGAEAFGCFCDLEYDSKCVAFNHASYRTRHSPNHGEPRDCRWLNYFITWLRSISAARIQVVEIENFKSFAFGLLSLWGCFNDDFFEIRMNRSVYWNYCWWRLSMVWVIGVLVSWNDPYPMQFVDFLR
jgi:hypothetical protein